LAPSWIHCLCTNIETEANICDYYPDIFLLMKNWAFSNQLLSRLRTIQIQNLFLPSTKIRGREKKERERGERRERRKRGREKERGDKNTRLPDVLLWLLRSKFKNKMIAFRHAAKPIGFAGKNGETGNCVCVCECVCVCFNLRKRSFKKSVIKEILLLKRKKQFFSTSFKKRNLTVLQKNICLQMKSCLV